MTEEEAIVAAEAEEAIKDKDKSNHRLIGGSNKDEGSDSDSSGGSGEGPAKVRRRSGEGPAKVWRRVRRDSGVVAGKFQWIVGSPIKIEP